VHHHLAAVGRDAGRVGSEDDGKFVFGYPDPAERPHVVVVERRGAHVDRLPAVGRRRLGDVANLQTRERLVAREARADCCEQGVSSSRRSCGCGIRTGDAIRTGARLVVETATLDRRSGPP